MTSNNKVKIAGSLYLLALVSGIFSVAPSVDTAEYLTQAMANEHQVIMAAIFQFVISFAYLGIAVLLYPLIQKYGRSLAIGFLSCRTISVTLSLIATALLLAIVAVSKIYMQNSFQDSLGLQAVGNVLKTSRDAINHVFMIVVLCTGNVLFYFTLIKAKLIPKWLSYWGIGANILSILASVLVLLRVVDIITTAYLTLNLPTALQELVLGLWLIVKGFNQQNVESNGFLTRL